MQVFQSNDIDQYKKKALHWASLFDTVCYFDSNSYADPYSAFDVLIACGVKEQVQAGSGHAFNSLNEFLNQTSGYRVGFFSYDLKNEVEELRSDNPDHLHFPELFFFEPQHLVIIQGSRIRIISPDAQHIHEQIQAQAVHTAGKKVPVNFQPRITREEYLTIVDKLREHIQKGDIYEVTFCQEFFAENTDVDPVSLFQELNAVSPTPFATFFKLQDKYIISATPERYLSRRGNKLISQPIKGTAGRSNDPRVDQKIKENLLHNEKEQAENVMIVDLVRNDLTRCAKPGTVRVEELFGIYSFRQVHQMISTVVCQADETFPNTEIIKKTFPMGSMTGAPKVRAMQLIEEYEQSRRGVFSGAVGYFSPDGDFDFNVVIRSVLYNASSGYLSYHVGSAITYESEAAREYDECILKASAIQSILK